MSQEFMPGSHTTLETLPLVDMHVDSIDPTALIMDVGHGLRLLRDLRRNLEDRQGIDGFVAVNAIPTNNRSLNQLGLEWLAHRKTGISARDFFFGNVDMSKSSLSVRDKFPGEDIHAYMDDIDRNVLQVNTRHPHYIDLPNPADAPGTRFIGEFQDDSDIVAIGKIWRGDIKGGRDTIDNSMYLSYLLDGLMPNFNGYISLDRGHWPTQPLAIERLAASYGEDSGVVIDHYREPLIKNLKFWMRGRSHLESIRHDRGEVFGRQILLPGPTHDIVFRDNSDAIVDYYDNMRGLREESAAEDEELAEIVLGSLTGQARAARFEKLMRDLRGACESTQDFADWQLENYVDLETIRTTDIAPIALQALMVNLMRMVGDHKEADRLSGVILRRFWRDIDETHGQFVDLTRDGKPTKALHAAQAYPLLVKGLVPYDMAIKLANTWRDVLVRPYGTLISAGRADQQWSGNPSPSNNGKQNDLFKKLIDPEYNSLQDEEGDNRTWPSVNYILMEAFLTAAQDAKELGQDPGPLLEVAEMIQEGILNGISEATNEFKFVGEKLNAVDPRSFVDGGEYGKSLKTAQRGFGMSIGAFRGAAYRNLRGELAFPKEFWWRHRPLQHIKRSAGGLIIAKTLSQLN